VIEIEVDRVPTIIAIRADKVHEVTELAPSALTEVPRVGMRWRPDYIRFIGKRGNDFIVVPDLARILSLTAADAVVDAPVPDRKAANLAAVGA
jgi:purine-binding chemotaxis protein CheW